MSIGKFVRVTETLWVCPLCKTTAKKWVRGQQAKRNFSWHIKHKHPESNGIRPILKKRRIGDGNNGRS